MPERPDAQQVAKRWVCVYAEILRAWCELSDWERKYSRLPKIPPAKTLRERALALINRPDVVDEASEHELRRVESPLGKLKKHEVSRGTCLAESLAVLGWALGDGPAITKLEKPSLYAYASRPKMLMGDPSEILSRPQLRASPEIDRFARTCETWYQRLALRRFINGGFLTLRGKAYTLSYAADLMEQAARRGDIELADGDLGRGGFDIDMLINEDDWEFESRGFPCRILATRWLREGGPWERTDLSNRLKIKFKRAHLASGDAAENKRLMFGPPANPWMV